MKRYGLFAFPAILAFLCLYPAPASAQEDPGVYIETPSLRDDGSNTAKSDRKLARLKKIAIDPGHGGRDFGAKSRNLFLEKEITHRLAMALKNTIEKRNGNDVSVILTRSGRKDTDQYKRAFAANSNGAELYISFHTASGFDQSSRDLGIYISEKGTSKSEHGSWKEINKKYSAYNAVLAEMLRKNLGSFYGHKKFFIRRGSFVPLYGIDMPGAVVEVIALNDPKDELKINDDEFYEKLSETIYAALADYDENL